MVRQILTTLLITSLWCGAEDYQIANKASAGLQILSSSLTTTEWTNTTVWITPNSPRLLSGTTNEVCVNYAPSSTNLIQSHTVANHASRTNLLGTNVYYFAGANYINLGRPLESAHQTGKFDFTVSFYDPLNNGAIFTTAPLTNQIGIDFQIISSRARFRIFDGNAGACLAVNPTNTVPTNQWNTVSLKSTDGASCLWNINGATGTTAFIRTPSNTSTSTAPFGLGVYYNNGNPQFYFNGYMKDFIIRRVP